MKDQVLNFTVLIEQDEDGVYVAKVPDIPGCILRAKPWSRQWMLSCL
jgi:hypothetical protein